MQGMFTFSRFCGKMLLQKALRRIVVLFMPDCLCFTALVAACQGEPDVFDRGVG